MTRPPRYLLSALEKNALLHQQATLIERQSALIEQQRATIEALTERSAVLEAERGKPRKTSRNSHLPPSQDPGSGKGKDRAGRKKSAKKPHPSRPGVSRRLAETPDETIVCTAERCACGADVSGLKQTCRIHLQCRSTANDRHDPGRANQKPSPSLELAAGVVASLRASPSRPAAPVSRTKRPDKRSHSITSPDDQKFLAN